MISFYVFLEERTERLVFLLRVEHAGVYYTYNVRNQFWAVENTKQF